MLDKIKTHLVNDWQEFADRFIPQERESIAYVRKHPELMLDESKVIDHERKLNMVRNSIYSSGLRRPFSDCTSEEIADDKLGRLVRLLDKRPELWGIIEQKI